jgi:hypothetical protein
MKGTMINWNDEKCQVTSHFTVKDCLYLHEWHRLADVDRDGVYLHKLAALCQKLEEIRDILKCPINVHSMFRSQAYNEDQKILPSDDVHSQSVAVDFDCEPVMTIEQVKNALRPLLESLDIRMEKGTTTWIHIDMRAPGPSGREFIP